MQASEVQGAASHDTAAGSERIGLSSSWLLAQPPCGEATLASDWITVVLFTFLGRTGGQKIGKIADSAQCMDKFKIPSPASQKQKPY